MSRKALHRGLKALISQDPDPSEDQTENRTLENSKIDIQIPVSDIYPNPFQPRKEFDKDELQTLAESIKRDGLLQPVLVRKSKGRYELISGERRLKAHQLIGFKKISAIIKDKVSDRNMQVLSLVENLQRSDLNDIEIAEGYKQLISQFNYTHEMIASDTGKSRSFVTNTIRLLKLSSKMQRSIINKELTSGHARAILTMDNETDREFVYKKILNNNFNVRQAEDFVQRFKNSSVKKNQNSKLVDIIELESKLARILNTRVEIKKVLDKGKIIIKFSSTSDLNRIVSVIE